MTLKEIKQAIKATRRALETASGTELFRLEEELETLEFLYMRRAK